jgi:putative oxidoreductase
MAVAYFKFHAPQGFWPLLHDGEGALLYCFIFLFLASAGGALIAGCGNVHQRSS